ncbi:MAG: putative manganese-dependent inorganic diphosphatase [Erysipelotrichaceae bacterium]|nr:putative manganese-dependent inorganic diphosphatase [Erysipelotrichaceae bacterium]
MKEKPIFVTGHLNPDTDAIASAIAYANLKKELGYNCVPGRLGRVSLETDYLLERFGFDEPTHIYTAKCTINDIDIDDAYLVTKDLTMKEALDLVLKRTSKGIFVVDNQKHLEGVVSISNLTSLWTVNEIDLCYMMSTASLENIIKTLKATVLNRADDFKNTGMVEFFPNANTAANITEGSITIVSNQPETQRRCIESGSSLIVIVGENWIDSVTLEMAKAKNVSVIHTSLSPLMVSQLIFQSPSIENIMVKDVISFSLNESVEDASTRISKTRFRSYPVLDDKKRVVGAISRYHLFNYEKKKFILVDHNEYKQSVPDLEHGEVIEVIDHHRLGGIKTSNPIPYTCMVIGSTCSIVALKYFEYKIALTKEMAGLLMGGIIADTLNLKSPTTSEIDHELIKKLAKIAKVDPNELAEGIINASASILEKRYVDIVYEDFKEFSIEDNRVAIAQTQCKNRDEFEQVKVGLQEYMDEVCTMSKYDVLLLALTDPNGMGSYFLVSGNSKADMVAEYLKEHTDENGFMEKVISRKKQIVPMVTEVFVKKN